MKLFSFFCFISYFCSIFILIVKSKSKLSHNLLNKSRFTCSIHFDANFEINLNSENKACYSSITIENDKNKEKIQADFCQETCKICKETNTEILDSKNWDSWVFTGESVFEEVISKSFLLIKERKLKRSKIKYYNRHKQSNLFHCCCFMKKLIKTASISK